ncbi:hypothetical protein ACXIUS_28970 [Bosea thiooxidans]
MQKHLACQTQYSRTGNINMQNRKPYRTAAQKALARQTARKCEDGAWRSTAPVSYHSK